jgi:DNA repair exonuclease SbcCD ATPase subunit
MKDFVTLTCPSCGGKLQITSDVERFACANCGNEHLVQRSGGIIALIPLVAGLRKVQDGVDRTASELAIKRLREEISSLEPEIQDLVDEVDEVNKLYKFLPKDCGVDEENIDKIIHFLEEDIQNLQKRKANNPFLGWVTGTSGKLKTIENLAEELRDLEVKINDKRFQLAKHERIVNQ